MSKCDNCTNFNDIYIFPCSMCQEEDKDVKAELLSQLKIYFKSNGGTVRRNAYYSVKSLVETAAGKKAFLEIYNEAVDTKSDLAFKINFQFIDLLNSIKKFSANVLKK